MKKVKLPLEMAFGKQVRSLQELKENWDLEKVLAYYLNGRLLTWLKDRYCYEEADKVEALETKSGEDLGKVLCDIFEVEFVETDISKIDVAVLENRNKRLEILRSYTADDIVLKNIDKVAFDQQELDMLLDGGETCIYLFKNIYKVPLTLINKNYIGIGDVEVFVNSKEIIDFQKLNIAFENIEFDEDYKKIMLKSPDYLYNEGKKLENSKNYIHAIEYYKKAAEHNHLDALVSLGYLYDMGYGVPQDYKLAVEYYQKAADLNSAWAMNNLGASYADGNGVEQNYDIAMKWYKKAAELGYSFSCKNIGSMYYYGNGVDQDYFKAFEWYKKAEDKAYACYMLGWMYEFGQGTDKNIEQAQAYYEKAAEKGYYDKNYGNDPTYRLGRILLFEFNNIEATRECLKKYYDKGKIEFLFESFIERIKEVEILDSSYCRIWMFGEFDVTKTEAKDKALRRIRDSLRDMDDSIFQQYKNIIMIILNLESLAEIIADEKSKLSISEKEINLIHEIKPLLPNLRNIDPEEYYSYLDVSYEKVDTYDGAPIMEFFAVSKYSVSYEEKEANRFLQTYLENFSVEMNSFLNSLKSNVINKIQQLKTKI